jgi:hypothetical protein
MYGGVDVYIHVSLTLALIGDGWSASRPRRFTPGEWAPDTYWIAYWVYRRDGLDDMGKWKFLTLPGLELRPSAVQSVAIHYTDCATASHKRCGTWTNCSKVFSIAGDLENWIRLETRPIFSCTSSHKRWYLWLAFPRHFHMRAPRANLSSCNLSLMNRLYRLCKQDRRAEKVVRHHVVVRPLQSRISNNHGFPFISIFFFANRGLSAF